MWLAANTALVRNISAGVTFPVSVFATLIGDIYLDTRMPTGQVARWTSNTIMASEPVMYISDVCTGLFLDIYENIYCTLGNGHMVLKKSFNDAANITTVVAGNGTNSSAPDTLSDPRGIFVDTSFNLYVADSSNHRIQRFPQGERIGTTLAGNGAPGTITLNSPCAVVLDADSNLFIVDRDNHRIVGSSIYGFRCIAGCIGSGGSASNQLNTPRRLSFDSYGNLLVSDSGNNRVQKFLLTINTCRKLNPQNETTILHDRTKRMSLSFSFRRFFQSTKIESLCYLECKCTDICGQQHTWRATHWSFYQH